jgi:hypothetical protein
MIQVLNIFKEKPVFSVIELATFFYFLYSVVKWGITVITEGGINKNSSSQNNDGYGILISFIGILLPLPLYFFALSKVLYVYALIGVFGFVLPFVIAPMFILAYDFGKEMIKKYKKNVKIKFVNSKIMNQLSYHADNRKLIKLGLNLKSNIQEDIKKTLKLFNYLK